MRYDLSHLDGAHKKCALVSRSYEVSLGQAECYIYFGTRS
jgi:hypothetical protein